MKNTHIRTTHEAHESLKAEGRSPYPLWLIWIIWLPFFIPPIITLFQSHPALPRLIATLVGVALFVGIYLWATWRNAQQLVADSSPSEHTEVSKWLTIGALTVLSLALVLLGKGNGWLSPFIFTSSYIAGSLPTVRAIQGVIALALLTIAVGLLAGLGSFEIGTGVVFVVVVGIIVTSIVRFIVTGRELRVAREEIARLAVMTERLRIARDLHDVLGHNLSLIALKSELARRLVNVAPERAIIEISDVETVARTTLQEVREAVGNYRRPTFSSELQGAQEILAAAGIAYRYEGDESIIGTLPTTIEAVLSWTVREGVTNVIRHSRAHQCTIRVTQERHTVCVEVLDDGANVPSLTVSQSQGLVSTSSNGNGGNGLRGLAERVATLGGRCDTGPHVNGGFRLAVFVPTIQSVAVAPPEHSDSYEERSEQR